MNQEKVENKSGMTISFAKWLSCTYTTKTTIKNFRGKTNDTLVFDMNGIPTCPRRLLNCSQQISKSLKDVHPRSLKTHSYCENVKTWIFSSKFRTL